MFGNRYKMFPKVYTIQHPNIYNTNFKLFMNVYKHLLLQGLYLVAKFTCAY